MRESPRRAAAEHKPDRGSAAFDADVAGINGFVWNIDAGHLTLTARPILIDRGLFCRNLPNIW
jgi:hypothetical protein